MSTKQDFVNWLIANVPGLDGYYGVDKLNQWANGSITSARDDKWFSQWQTGDVTNLKNSIIGVITGINPQYADYMAKAKRSGDFMRRLIDTISQFVQDTKNQVTMWQNIVNSQTTTEMKDFAQKLLTAYQAQFRQSSNTLDMYKKDFEKGLADGIYV